VGGKEARGLAWIKKAWGDRKREIRVEPGISERPRNWSGPENDGCVL